MHALVFVLIPETGDPEAHVARLMAPHEETETGGHWDWFQIGGRYTGWISGYDPQTDPENVERCWLCQGTGKRTDMVVRDGCNHCKGKGEALKWPTQWRTHLGDVASAGEALEARAPYALVTPQGRWLESCRWNGSGFVEAPDWQNAVADALASHTGRVVVVDYHS